MQWPPPEAAASPLCVCVLCHAWGTKLQSACVHTFVTLTHVRPTINNMAVPASKQARAVTFLLLLLLANNGRTRLHVALSYACCERWLQNKLEHPRSGYAAAPDPRHSAQTQLRYTRRSRRFCRHKGCNKSHAIIDAFRTAKNMKTCSP